jgi:nitronate monooxygenase
MLEAERAGAKALVVFMDEHPRNGEAWKVLRQVQNEEAHNCALIGRLLEKAGVPYSHATGEFYDKAVAIKGSRQRIEFLIRGLKWAVKQFEQAFPTLDPAALAVFTQMRDSHLRSIAACETILKALPR